MKAAQLSLLLRARTEKKPTVLVTELAGGGQLLSINGETTGDLEANDAILAEIARALADDRSRTVDIGDGHYFIQVFNPPRRMIVVGAVHIAQSLVPMAAIAGFAVTVVDPRGAFATELRFPGVTLSQEWPDDAMEALAPDRRTAIVTLTHDPKLDDPALAIALRSDAFYIGALGSRRTHGRRLERLRELGFADRALDRIHGPIGLDIGATSPAEIAISILGEVTETLHRPAADKAA